MEIMNSLVTGFVLALQAGPPPAAGGEAWYKVATGIIAIPAAVLGLVISYNILRKTTLESRKLELEIQDRAPRQGLVGADVVTVAMASTSDLQRAVLLIIRFVVLELTLRLWSVVPSAVGYVTAAAASTFFFVSNADFDARFTVAASLIPTAIRLIFDLIYWVMLFGFGWPLLKDTCAYLGIPIQSLLDLPYIGRWKNRSVDV